MTRVLRCFQKLQNSVTLGSGGSSSEGHWEVTEIAAQIMEFVLAPKLLKTLDMD